MLYLLIHNKSFYSILFYFILFFDKYNLSFSISIIRTIYIYQYESRSLRQNLILIPHITCLTLHNLPHSTCYAKNRNPFSSYFQSILLSLDIAVEGMLILLSLQQEKHFRLCAFRGCDESLIKILTTYNKSIQVHYFYICLTILIFSLLNYNFKHSIN